MVCPAWQEQGRGLPLPCAVQWEPTAQGSHGGLVELDDKGRGWAAAASSHIRSSTRWAVRLSLGMRGVGMLGPGQGLTTREAQNPTTPTAAPWKFCRSSAGSKMCPSSPQAPAGS